MRLRISLQPELTILYSLLQMRLLRHIPIHLLTLFSLRVLEVLVDFALCF